MYDKKLRIVRLKIERINKEFNSVPISFTIRRRIGRQFENVEINKIFLKIEYDKTFDKYKIFLKNDNYHYIIISTKELNYHSTYEFPKIILSINETLEKITHILNDELPLH